MKSIFRSQQSTALKRWYRILHWLSMSEMKHNLLFFIWKQGKVMTTENDLHCTNVVDTSTYGNKVENKSYRIEHWRWNRRIVEWILDAVVITVESSFVRWCQGMNKQSS